MASLKDFLEDKNYTFVKMEVLPTNHLALEIKLNGVKAKFILDTGASSSCVDLAAMESFGIYSADGTIQAAGAGDGDMQGEISKGNSLRIGSWKWKNMDVVLLDLSHVNHALTREGLEPILGIIGADVLQRSKAIIDYKKHRLFLR